MQLKKKVFTIPHKKNSGVIITKVDDGVLVDIPVERLMMRILNRLYKEKEVTIS